MEKNEGSFLTSKEKYQEDSLHIQKYIWRIALMMT